MKNKKIIFVRSNSINPDPRVEKEANFLKKDYSIEILGWDRECKLPKNENKNGLIIHRLRIKGRYGAGRANILSLLKWVVGEFFWLLNHHFDVIHACDFDTYVPALFAAKIKRKKIVYDIFDLYGTGNGTPHFLQMIIKKTDIFLFKFANGIVVPNDKLKKSYEKLNPKKIISIFNAPEDFYLKTQKTIENSKKSPEFKLGFIGILEKERGFDQILEIMSELTQIELIIGGYGRYEEEIKKRIIGRKNIKFIGKVYPYEKTIEILAGCDAFFSLYDPIIPNHKFSSPNKLFEAMMFGKPIIVSKYTGMDEIVEQYDMGITVNYNNKLEIKEAILKLAEMKRKGINHYGENGRRAYVKNFAPDILKNRLLEFYRSVYEN